jgi:protein involved in polysaccharide export with SLBB domain
VLPRLNPISAAGRTFGSFRNDVEAAVRRAYVSTNAFVSVARVRQISVLVSGEVNTPGTRIVPGLASVVDALVLSGGVNKTGSLRNVRIERGDKRYVVDLYAVLSNASSPAAHMQLADGDRILVPPLGKVVAVSGMVRQPGIYELPSGASSMKAQDLLALAGGLEVRGRYRLSVLRIAANGNSQMAPLADENGTIGDSEILFAQLGADQTVSQATLSGDTSLAGKYPITDGTKLSDVLKAPGALPGAPYTLFGIIARKDPRTLLRTLLAFTPVAILNGTEDQVLQSDDIIKVLSVNEVRLLTDTLRLYSQRQEAEQAAIRNPLVETGPNETNTDTNQGGAAVAGQAQNQLTAAGSPASTMSLADAQRRDIAELATQIDPVTRQTLAAQAEAERSQITEQQFACRQANPQNLAACDTENSFLAMQIAPSSQPSFIAQNDRDGQVLNSGQGTNVGPAVNNGSVNSRNTDSASPPRLPVQPPASNFQTIDATSGQIASNREITNFADLARQLNVDQLVLVNFLADHQVLLNGAVSGPGSYFIGPSVVLQDLVQAAGGTANWADESGVELITTVVDRQTGRSATRRTELPLHQGMLADYVVHPRDQLRFNQVFTDSGLGTATVQGEVRYTGTYQIIRGEHLSDLLARAGGLTSTAYPYGTVFLRKSAAANERAGYLRAAQEVEEGLVVAMTRIGSDKIDSTSFAALQGFVTQLRNTKAVGRIAIAADPSVLAARPELDPLLEPGDVVYIPQRPSTVSVLGQVMQPGSLPYRSGNTLRDYINMAGGYNSSSDASNTFVVLPDGSARRVDQSWFNFSPTDLPPGSTIVVPRDITPLDTRQLILDITGIFSQLAVSAASLAVLSKQ